MIDTANLNAPAAVRGATGLRRVGALLLFIVLVWVLSWLLSLAVNLPFYIGLFFFALFGLMIGAAAFRVGEANRPVRRGVYTGTAIIVIVTWGVAMWHESTRFPAQMADEAISAAKTIGERTAREYRDYIASQVVDFVDKSYPPGGTIGYMRWASTDAAIRRADIDGLRRDIDNTQSKLGWTIRAALSFLLLAWGVASQTLPLCKEPGTEQEEDDEESGGTEDVDDAGQAEKLSEQRS